MSGSAPFWVQSLTAFKKHFFGIEDKLSFERAFYIKDLHGQLVRLQNIRFIPFLTTHRIKNTTSCIAPPCGQSRVQVPFAPYPHACHHK
jgi:hypothetical protein